MTPRARWLMIVLLVVLASLGAKLLTRRHAAPSKGTMLPVVDQLPVEPMVPSVASSATSSSADLDDRPVFMDALPFRSRELLTLEDVPNLDPQEAVAWGDHLYVAANARLGVYDLEGHFQRTADPQVLRCTSSLTDVVRVDNQLFVACLGYGVYQLDLQREKVVGLYTAANGLRDVDNIRLAASADGSVWVGTYDGLGKIDPKTQKVDYFDGMLVSGCKNASLAPLVSGNEVWVVFQAHATCAGGVVRQQADGSWKRFGPADFAVHDLTRIDIEQFAITADGRVRAAFRDDLSAKGGADYRLVAAEYSVSDQTWKRVETAIVNTPDEDRLNDAFRNQVGGSVSSLFSSHVSAEKGIYPMVSIREVTQGKTVHVETRSYGALTRMVDRIYLLRAGGIDVLDATDAWPKPWLQDERITGEGWLSVSVPSRFLIVTDVARNEFEGGTVLGVAVVAVNEADKTVFYNKFDTLTDVQRNALLEANMSVPLDVSSHGAELWLGDTHERYVCVDMTKKQSRLCFLPK